MFLLLLVSLYYFLAITHNLATFAIPAIPTLPQCQRLPLEQVSRGAL